jgi:hypothetical protein
MGIIEAGAINFILSTQMSDGFTEAARKNALARSSAGLPKLRRH